MKIREINLRDSFSNTRCLDVDLSKLNYTVAGCTSSATGRFLQVAH